MEGQDKYLVEMRNVFKFYKKVIALAEINFNIGYNEIVGLIGDNGAGKSTLIKILTGVLLLSKGELYIKGKKIIQNDYSSKKAHALGIETVYQERALGEKQTLWRNIFMGRQITNPLGFIKISKEKEETRKLMEDIMGFRGVGVKAESKVDKLSGGEKQGVAIGRALYFNADLVILDEPTIALSLNETEKVLNFIRKLKNSSKSCILISHNISEVYSVADRFILLDRGYIVGQYRKDEVSLEEITKKFLMFCK